MRSYDVTQATLLTLEVTPRQVITPATQVGDWELKYNYFISISSLFTRNHRVMNIFVF